ncbi:MAG: preprotein translocase subunit SecE [Verrucomicrobia bacterium]|nr:preprotein translocase subunit SecE [Verrucomicrobiota bacterium]
MKKTSWPTRQELMSSTVMVIVSVVLVSAFVGISDKLLATLLKLLIPSG